MAIGYWILPFPPIPYFLSLNLSDRFIIYFFLFSFAGLPFHSLLFSISLFDLIRQLCMCSRRSMMWCCQGSSQLSLLTLPSVASRFSSFSRFRNRYRIASFFLLFFLFPLFWYRPKKEDILPSLHNTLSRFYIVNVVLYSHINTLKEWNAVDAWADAGVRWHILQFSVSLRGS